MSLSNQKEKIDSFRKSETENMNLEIRNSKFLLLEVKSRLSVTIVFSTRKLRVWLMDKECIFGIRVYLSCAILVYMRFA